eukprot:12229189-Alexandrium_andersonii.AAC.1
MTLIVLLATLVFVLWRIWRAIPAQVPMPTAAPRGAQQGPPMDEGEAMRDQQRQQLREPLLGNQEYFST